MLERRYGGFDYGIVATDAPRRQTDTRIAAFSPVPVARLVAVQDRRLSVVRADLTHEKAPAEAGGMQGQAFTKIIA